MEVEETIYAEPFDNPEYSVPGERITLFYMHGEAESRTGYDCCNGNIQAFRRCLRAGAFVANLVFPDGSQELCIVNSKYGHGGMQGLICLLSDLEAIKFVFKNTGEFPTMYEHEKEFLKSNYPEVVEVIREIVKNS